MVGRKRRKQLKTGLGVAGRDNRRVDMRNEADENGDECGSKADECDSKANAR